jgi:hypothetical protein
MSRWAPGRSTATTCCRPAPMSSVSDGGVAAWRKSIRRAVGARQSKIGHRSRGDRSVMCALDHWMRRQRHASSRVSFALTYPLDLVGSVHGGLIGL